MAVLSNPLGRKLVAMVSRKGVVGELSKGTATDQIQRLDEMVGTGNLSGRKLKEAIMREAPGQMDAAIKKYRKQGKEITVDSLLVEVRSEPGFLKMCEGVGLSLAWFENLASDRIAAMGV